ncbi:hypothetical protein ACLOJK_015010, partial [Asimina triloba]
PANDVQPKPMAGRVSSRCLRPATVAPPAAVPAAGRYIGFVYLNVTPPPPKSSTLERREDTMVTVY